MILIGLGSNLTTEEFKSSREVLEGALRALEEAGIKVVKCSRFYETEPVPKSDQPWYVNAVAQIDTELDAHSLLAKLHELEQALGRIRRERWEARIIDLDLLSFHDQILPSEEQWQKEAQKSIVAGVIVPHARMHNREFVLAPLAEIAPNWRHPVLKTCVRELLSGHNSDGIVRLLH